LIGRIGTVGNRFLPKAVQLTPERFNP
jgi:hypothetical protein